MNKNNIIPCLGVLCLNRGDLLLRLVNSIDQEIDKFCIVQNSSNNDVEDAITQIKNGLNPLIKNVYINKPFRNMGVAPAWNTIIKSFPECEYWLIANNDTVFLPNDLEKYHNLQISNKNNVIVAANGSFSCFSITPQIIDMVGLFDENIWPIYFEDLDYYIRMTKANIAKIPINSEIGYSNDGSWTIRSNNKYHQNNSYTQSQNQNYLMNKWGTLDITNKTQGYKNPFNHNSIDLKTWWYDPEYRKQQSSAWDNFEETANRN